MIISVDHGNKSIKTPNALFTSGLISSEGLQGIQNGLYLLERALLYADRTAHFLSARQNRRRAVLCPDSLRYRQGTGAAQGC